MNNEKEFFLKKLTFKKCLVRICYEQHLVKILISSAKQHKEMKVSLYS